jgi:hypothetical protein
MKRTPMRFPIGYFALAYKHDIQGVFFKCAEILPTRLFDNVVVPFDEFYYQLKLMHLFLLHPVAAEQQ